MQAKILGKPPQPIPHWWAGISLKKPLPLLTFSVNLIAPKPDNFFTGTIFDLYSKRLTNLFGEAGIRHETFPVKLINRKTQETLSMEYDIFHLLEIHPGIDKKLSDNDEELVGVSKLVLTKDCIKAKRKFFRIKEVPEIVVIHKDLKNVFDSHSNYSYDFQLLNKKSPPSNTPSKITFTASASDKASNPNDFKRVCVVRTDGMRNRANGRDVLNNW